MQLKTTEAIFKNLNIFYDENLIDKNIISPKTFQWDNSREMKIEDVDLWEIVYEQGGAFGLYASWLPYAEFYMLRVGWYLESQGHGVETYYGPEARFLCYKRMKDFGINLNTNKVWVDSQDIHLYHKNGRIY